MIEIYNLKKDPFIIKVKIYTFKELYRNSSKFIYCSVFWAIDKSSYFYILKLNSEINVKRMDWKIYKFSESSKNPLLKEKCKIFY